MEVTITHKRALNLGLELGLVNLDLGLGLGSSSSIHIINSKARLPIPIGDEIVYIKDVVDTMVPWPKHLVFLSTTAKVKIILL